MTLHSRVGKHSGLKFKPGFTILEMIIYTAIVGMIMVTVVYVMNTTYNVRARVSSSYVVHESMEFAEERMAASLHNANAVVIPASGTSSTLQLSMSDAALDPTIYSLSNGQIWLKEGTRANLPLTSSEVTISSLQFMRGTSTPPLIRILMIGNTKNAKGSYSAPLTLTTSAIIKLDQ
jgi:type II secretory pathway pseudopilin PulG